MRLMICAGASGGGVNPALAVIQTLKPEEHELLWVGSEGGMEANLVQRANIPFKSVPAGGIHGMGLRSLFNSFKLIRGYFAAKKIIRDFKPDVLFFTGGYVAIPTGLAGRKIPTLLCLPDIEPGLAIKVLSRFADHIAVPAEESKQFLPTDKNITITGYPVRKELFAWDKEEAFKVFDLDPKKPTLLVTGGSLGARSINKAVLKSIKDLLSRMQVIHITGQTTWQEFENEIKSIPEELAKNYRPYPYLHKRMGAAYEAADLVISRAGASIIGEFPLFELPAITVPYPHAWRYQIVNAEYLSKNGSAVLLRDENLNENLLAVILEIMEDKERLTEMKIAMKSHAIPDSAERISGILLNLAETGQGNNI